LLTRAYAEKLIWVLNAHHEEWRLFNETTDNVVFQYVCDISVIEELIFYHFSILISLTLQNVITFSSFYFWGSVLSWQLSVILYLSPIIIKMLNFN
jgi:hypothetical protein